MNSQDVFTDWQEGQAPLKGRLLAGTLRWLRDRIARIEAGGLVAEGIARAEVAGDGRSFRLVTSQERPLADIPLATSPFRERPEGYIAGIRYDQFDWWFDATTRSSYVVRADHVATSLPDALAGGQVGYLARGGSDAEVYQGAYDGSRSYVLGDIVQTGSDSTNSVLWKAFADIPAGVAPGSDYRWGAISVPQVRDIVGSYNGSFRGGQTLMFRKLARTTVIPPSFQGSVYGQNVGAAGVGQKFVIDAVNQGNLGSITVAAGATEGQFTKAASGYTYLAAGTVLTVRSDPTFHAVDQDYTSAAIMRSFTILGG